MYTLVVVDDEEDIRRGIVESIDWAAWGYAVIGEASDGEEAISLVEKLQPNVVLSDIRMPVMGGVDLMRYMHSSHPETKVVILSGYSDFEYLDEAIKNDVSKYLLKPTDLAQFAETFRAVREQLDQQEENRGKIRRSMAYLREERLNRLLQGGSLEEEILAETLADTALGTAVEGCTVVAVGMNYSIEYFRNTHPSVRLWIKREMCERVNELLDETDGVGGIFFLGPRAYVTGLVKIPQGGATAFWERCENMIRTRIGIWARFGVSRPATAEQTLQQCLEEAEWALDHRNERFMLGATGKCCFTQPEGVVYPGESNLTACLLENGSDQLHELIERFFKPFFDNIYKKHILDTACMRLLLQLSDAALKVGVALPALMAEQNLPLEVIYDMESAGARRQYVLYCLFCLRQAKPIIHRGNPSEKLAAEAKEYVDAHFTSPQLSLSQVAEHLGRNATYISHAFKNAGDTSFVQYVREKRMQKALELLDSPKAKVYEVAVQVGYPDQTTFVRLFKKHYGVTPGEYRQRHEASGGKNEE